MRVWAALISITTMPARAITTTGTCQQFTVGTSVQVRVADGNRPVAGLPLRLAKAGPGGLATALRAVTGAAGVAWFRNLAPGTSYTLTVPHDEAGSGCGTLQVKAGAGSVAALKWPTLKPHSARALKGILRASGAKARMILRVSEAVSGRVVDTGRTDEIGRFEFPEIAPGLYLLKVLHPAQGFGTLLVQVAEVAARDQLFLELRWEDRQMTVRNPLGN